MSSHPAAKEIGALFLFGQLLARLVTAAAIMAAVAWLVMIFMPGATMGHWEPSYMASIQTVALASLASLMLRLR